MMLIKNNLTGEVREVNDIDESFQTPPTEIVPITPDINEVVTNLDERIKQVESDVDLIVEVLLL